MRKSITAVLALAAILMAPALTTTAHASNFQVDNKTRFTIKVFVTGQFTMWTITLPK
jgi:hypothetical protein